MIVVLEGDKPYGWNHVRIMNLRLPVYGSIHVIASKNDAASYNRRQNYRVFLGVEGTMESVADPEAKNVLVKDISVSGIGLITKTEEPYKRGDIITVNFNEKESGTDFQLKVLVVRNEEMEDGRFNIGGLVKSNSDVVARFVYSKQQKKMKSAGSSS